MSIDSLFFIRSNGFVRSASLITGIMLVLSVHSVSSAPELTTAAVKNERISRHFRLDGEVEAINQATISAQTSGVIEEILVDVDDYVEQGALIIRLKDISQQAQLKKALAGEKEAIANLSNAQSEYKRIKDVFDKKVVSRADMDAAEHALAAAKARLESARAGLQEAREQLSYTRITAPYSGIVTRRLVEPGETVQPGTRLMTGVSLEQLRVNVDIPQSLINKIRRYAKASVIATSPLSGEVVELGAEKITIFPIADRASNTFKVRLDLPHGSKGLFPGMFVKVALVTGEKEVLVVPPESVVYRSEVTAVYVVDDDGNIGFRHVRLGNISAGRQEVLSGLSEGERVAVDPIQAGARLIEQRQQAQE